MPAAFFTFKLAILSTMLYDTVQDTPTRKPSQNKRQAQETRPNEVEMQSFQSLVNNNEQKTNNDYSLFSRCFFNWITPLVNLANRRPLHKEDAFDLPNNLQCDYNADLLADRWNKYQSLVAAIRDLYLPEYAHYGWLLLASGLLAFVGPTMLDALVSAAEHGAPWSHIIAYILLMFAAEFMSAFFLSHYDYRCDKMSVAMGAGLKGLVHSKVLRLSAYSRQLYTIGNLTNLYTVDIERVVGLTIALHYFWVLPLQIVVALVMLYYVVSYAMFAGFAAIVFILICNNINAKRIKRVMTSRDVRMRDVGEVFGAILTIKLNAWEAKFRGKIAASRETELKHLWDLLLAYGLNIFLLWMAPSFVSVVTIAFYVKALGSHMEAGKIFTALSLFRLLQEPLRSLPRFITMYYQAKTSAARLKKLLAMEEKIDCYGGEASALNDGTVVIRTGSFVWHRCPETENGVFEPDDDASALLLDENDENDDREEGDEDEVDDTKTISDIASFQLIVDDLVLLPRDLIIIRGPVGSGKSSVCAALLSEMYATSNTYMSKRGSIAYASQQAWIQSATVRENILFGHEYHHEKYNRVVDACCLRKDIAEWTHGDLTHIGGRGLNLSGGQQARIALARAVYTDADIYILDDILAALDSIVGNKIFDKCIVTLLAGKTRVLVTHKEDVIYHPSVNKIVTMSEGRCDVENVIDAANNEESRVASILDVNYSVVNPLPYPVSSSSEEESDAEESEYGAIAKKKRSKSSSKSYMKRALTVAEDRKVGSVSYSVYVEYFKSAGGMKMFLLLMVIQTIWQLLSIGSDVFISFWTKQSSAEQKQQIDWNIIVYSALALGSGLFVLFRTLAVAWLGFRAARVMFQQMLDSLLAAPMAWFDRNPTGRVLNRFADDQNNVDAEVPGAVGSIIAVIFSFCGNMLTVAFITRYLGIIVIPIGFIFNKILTAYLNASRELKRLQAITLSPVLTYMSQTVDGITVIRSFGDDAVSRTHNHNQALINTYSKMTFSVIAAREWFTLRMRFIGALILLFTAFLLFLGAHYISPSMVALSLSYGLLLAADVMSLVDIWAWFENTMVSPERVLQYCHLPKEGSAEQKALYSAPTNKPATEQTSLLGREETPTIVTTPLNRQLGKSVWPSEGVVEFRHVWFKYQPESEPILRDLTFTTRPREKIGIVGRTGAGKSSLSMCLFRIAELHKGQVLIDGVDISTLSLHCLRSRVAIIPQAPVLFKGPLRSYLDPFDEYTDADIWTVLEKGNIADTFRRMSTDGGLTAELAENGDNLSVGQRQILVLCRALLCNAKVLLMDEATASMDYATDKELQLLIRNEFRDATVLTIAHRIDTIVDCDRVMVMSQGSIVEFDDPKVLLAHDASYFRDLAYEAGVMSP